MDANGKLDLSNCYVDKFFASDIEGDEWWDDPVRDMRNKEVRYLRGGMLINGMFSRINDRQLPMMRRFNTPTQLLIDGRTQTPIVAESGFRFDIINELSTKSALADKKEKIARELRNAMNERNPEIRETESTEFQRYQQIEIEPESNIKDGKINFQTITELFNNSKFLKLDNESLTRVTVEELFQNHRYSNVKSISYFDLMLLLANSGVKLYDMTKVSAFLKRVNFSIPKSSPKRKRVKRTHYLPGSIEYNQLKIKIDYYRRNQIANKIGREIVNLSINFRGYCRKIIGKFRSTNDFYKIIFMASGTGKTSLSTRLPLCFFDIDGLKSKQQLETFHIKIKMLKEKYKGEKDRMSKVWRDVNAEWQRLVLSSEERIFKNNRVLLAHSPSQIPKDILDKSQCFIMVPETIRNLRFQISNIKDILNHDNYEIVQCDFSMYLVITMLLFQLDLDLVKVRDIVV